MKHRYYDLHINAENLEEKIKFAEYLGWDGICLVKEFDRNFSSFYDEVRKLKRKADIEILIGAQITGKTKKEVSKEARASLEYADIILANGSSSRVRSVAECWEIDILCYPEKGAEKDFLDYKNSGMDHTIARLMAERFIALEINFSEILNSYGILRSQVIGRMRQNLILAKKYSVPVILVSGAREKYDMRSPRELIAIGMSTGMKEEDAKKALEENPLRIIKKSRDRKDPAVIMKGLEVVRWGGQKPVEKKRMYGWY